MRMVAPLEVGICCADLPRLKAFYVEQLGFQDVSCFHVPAEKAGAAGLTRGAYTVQRIQSPWGERIKLLQPAAPPAPRAREDTILARTGTAYLTFIVADLQRMLGRLVAAGVELLSGARMVEVRPGVFLVFARDPEGNILEFVQYADLAGYRPDAAARPA